MYALNSFKFLDSVVAPTTSNALSIGRASQLVLQVSGTSTSFSITVEGKVDANASRDTIGVIKNSDFTTPSAITSVGVYTMSVDGYYDVVVKLTAIGNGNVTVYGKSGE
jgi:hypothetical protein